MKRPKPLRLVILVSVLAIVLVACLILSSNSLRLALQVRWGLLTGKTRVLDEISERVDREDAAAQSQIPWWVVSPAIRDRDPMVRITAAHIQYRLHPDDPEGFNTILSALHDSNPEVRGIAASELHHFDRYSDRRIEALERCLFDDPDKLVRSSAALTLLGLSKRYPKCRAILDRAVSTQSSEETRAQIAKLIARWDSR